jgi:hypothetical protein
MVSFIHGLEHGDLYFFKKERRESACWAKEKFTASTVNSKKSALKKLKFLNFIIKFIEDPSVRKEVYS